MSLAVFTDSTTAQASPAFTWRFAAGNSTNTTSVNSCWAWSVIPIVAMSPLTRTHSCDLAYFKSEGTFDILEFSQDLCVSSNRFSIKRFGDNYRRGALAANLDLNRLLGLGELRLHITHAHADPQRRTLRAADHLADHRSLRSRAPDWIMRPGRRGFIRHFKSHQLLDRAPGFLLRQRRAA